MLFNELLEALVGGHMFLDCGKLVSWDVFGDVAAVLTMLEVVVGLPVGAGANDGDVAALHAGDGGHLSDTCGEWGGLHTGRIYALAYTEATKKIPQTQEILSP
jgi:hypothetical protein